MLIPWAYIITGCERWIWAGKQIFRRFRFWRGTNMAFIIYGTWCYMMVLLYDLKFRLDSFDMFEPSLCIRFFPMYFLVSTQIQKQTFKLWIETLTLTTDAVKILLHFLLYKVCNRLKLNLLCTWSFSLWKEVFFKIDVFCLFFLYKLLFFARGARTFNMDMETGSMIFRRSVYLFILQTNTINQIATYVYY